MGDEMEHLAGNDYINDRIHKYSTLLCSRDKQRIFSKFRADVADVRKFESYRELTFGWYLCHSGFNPVYEEEVQGLTPDWVLKDADGQITEIIDVVTLHLRREAANSIAKGLMEKGSGAAWTSMPQQNIYSKLDGKAGRYAQLAERLQVPYIIAVFGEFFVNIAPEEIASSLTGTVGIFAQRPNLSGVVYWREVQGQYEFTHFVNEGCQYKSGILKEHGVQEYISISG